MKKIVWEGNLTINNPTIHEPLTQAITDDGEKEMPSGLYLAFLLICIFILLVI